MILPEIFKIGNGVNFRVYMQKFNQKLSPTKTPKNFDIYHPHQKSSHITNDSQFLPIQICSVTTQKIRHFHPNFPQKIKG